MSVDDVTAINFTAPLFTLIFAYLFFKESVEKTTIILLLLGFFGIFIIFNALYLNLGLLSLIAILSPILWSLSNICFKKASLEDDKFMVVCRLSFVMTMIAIPYAITQWKNPNYSDLLIFFGMALSSLAVHYFQTMAYQKAEMNVLQPFEFSRLLFVIFLELIFLGTLPTIYVLLGAFVIFSSNFLMLYFENRKKVRLYVKYR